MNGKTVLSFTRSDLSDLDATQDMIYAFDPSSTNLAQHRVENRATFTINFATGEATENSDDTKTFHTAHGWCMMLGWGVMLPTGGFIARYTRELDPWKLNPALWFRLHVGIQSTGLLVAIAGWIIIMQV